MPLMTSPRAARHTRGTLTGFALTVAVAGCSLLLAQAPAPVSECSRHRPGVAT